MTEVQMSVAETTEQYSMEVETVVGKPLRNPCINITLYNTLEPSGIPLPIRTFGGYDIENERLIDAPIVAFPDNYASGRIVTLYQQDYDVYYLQIPRELDVSEFPEDLVNCTYGTTELAGSLIVTDPTKDASAVLFANR